MRLKASTKKSDQIHDYYLKIEKLNFEYILKQQIEIKSQAINQAIALEKERHLLENSKNTSGIYWLINDSLKLCKFGSSNNIYNRVKTHKREDFKDFLLDNIMESSKYIDLENRIRPYSNETYQIQ